MGKSISKPKIKIKMGFWMLWGYFFTSELNGLIDYNK